MLSNQYNQNTIVHNYENDQNIQIQLINTEKQEQYNDIDYNFCQIYYETNDNTLINRLVSLNGIKSMKLLDAKLPNDFNWKAYSKYCQGLNNEILIKKHYLESYYRKLEADQILNIIIIKKTRLPLDTVILDFNNMKVTLSIISEENELIEHYNVKKYIANNDITSKLNEVIRNNTSKYYMIIFDNYNFEYNFVNKICSELDDLFSIDSLLLVSESESDLGLGLGLDLGTGSEKGPSTLSGSGTVINTESTTIEYFKINTNYLRTLSEPYVCLLNNTLKTKYDYSITDIGLTLYINQLLKKFTNTLTSVDFKFKITESEQNKLLLRDTLSLFDIYISNIEDNILDSDINKIIELSNDDNDNNTQQINTNYIDQITSTLAKSGEYVNQNQDQEQIQTQTQTQTQTQISNNIEIIKKSNKHNSKIELDFLVRENNGIMNV